MLEEGGDAEAIWMIQSNKGSMATTRVQEAATAAEKAYQLVKRSRKGACPTVNQWGMEDSC